MAAAIIASQWQWHDKAIASLGSAKYWDDMEIRFPLAYSEIIDNTAKKTDIANYLLLALARQESAFNPLSHLFGWRHGVDATDARNSQRYGAQSTILAIEKRHSCTARRSMSRLQANTTVTMLDRYDDNRILASAAYNAGPRRVDQWLSKSDGNTAL